MAWDCQKFGQFPRSGDWFGQNDYEMKSMQVAEMAYNIYKKQQSEAKWTLKDAEFVDWVESDE